MYKKVGSVCLPNKFFEIDKTKNKFSKNLKNAFKIFIKYKLIITYLNSLMPKS